jgi:hypothetical protein
MHKISDRYGQKSNQGNTKCLWIKSAKVVITSYGINLNGRILIGILFCTKSSIIYIKWMGSFNHKGHQGWSLRKHKGLFAGLFCH